MNRQGGVLSGIWGASVKGEEACTVLCIWGTVQVSRCWIYRRGLAGIWGWEPDHREPHVHAATLKLQLVYLGSDCSVFKQKKSARFSVLERTHWWWSGEWTSESKTEARQLFRKKAGKN